MKRPLLKMKIWTQGFFYSLLPYLRYKRVLITSIVIPTMLLFATLLTLITNGNPDIVSYRQHVEVIPFRDGLHVVVNNKPLPHLIQAEKCQRFSSSIDGTVAVFLTDQKELFLVRNGILQRVSNDVIHFEVSSSGLGLAYAQKYADQNALTLYSVNEGTRCEITTSLTRLDFSLSPDGKSLAFYSQLGDKEALMYYRNGYSAAIATQNADLVGLSDDGKYIYAVCPITGDASALYSFSHKGDATELGAVSSVSFKFNSNHRQIMFYDNGKTFISINGQPAIPVSSYPLYLVTVPNSQSASDSNSITLPVTSLFDHIYTCSDGISTSAWLIRKNPKKSKQLISRVSGCTLDASAKYLYFIHDQSQLCVMDIANRMSKIVTLAEKADSYTVTSNRNQVYYTDDGSLYCTNGKKTGSPKLIASNVSAFRLVIGASDSIYYLNDHSVYVCKNGRKPELISQNMKSVYNAPNNVVYIIGEEKIYTAYTHKQPNIILGTD